MQTKQADVTIIGAGLTGLTTAFYLSRAGLKTLVVEKAPRTGGVINTEKKQGFVFETGPNTGVIATPELVELFDILKDNIQVEIANPKARFRWIWKNRTWHTLPSGPISAIKTPLFTGRDKWRILAEPLRKKGTDKNETVAAMVRRRLGESYLQYAVDPFISGIYAGNPEQLVTRFALPKLFQLEQKYGSFIGGSFKNRKKTKTPLEKRVSREIFSIHGGLSNLTHALTLRTGTDNIFTHCTNVKITAQQNSYNTTFTNQQDQQYTISSPIVVSTIGGTGLSGLLPFINDNQMKQLSNTRYAKVVQVVACYKNWEGIPVNAFGGLMPSTEKRNCLGILFTSSIFKQRAPENGAILSVFMGGIRHPEIFQMNDYDLEQLALNEINTTLKSSTTPDIIEIHRYAHAIPQYDINTEIRLQAIQQVQQQHPGLYIAGNLRDGIGMADRVKQGTLIAREILHEK